MTGNAYLIHIYLPDTLGLGYYYPRPSVLCHTFKMSRSRAFIFTLNNYSEDDETYLQTVLVCRYIVYGREKAPKTGTPHLQGFVYFDHPRAFDSVRKLRKWSIQVAKGDVLQNAEYCKKDDDWFEKGDRPATSKEKGDGERDRYKRAYELAMAGDYTSIDSDILLRHYPTLKRLRAELTVVKDLDHLPLCMYFHGPTGVGKSRLARELCGDRAFRKEPLTKWFTGYSHEEIVWVDEIEPLDSQLQALYKRLCDHYCCPVETKGGNVLIRPKVIIFTSNFTPKQVFGINLEPMLRRLKVFDFTLGNHAGQVKACFEEYAQAHGYQSLAQGGAEGLHREEPSAASSS